MGNPNDYGRVQEKEQIPHAHVNARASETRVKDGEADAGGCEATSSSNISGSTEGQIAKDGLRIYLC